MTKKLSTVIFLAQCCIIQVVAEIKNINSKVGYLIIYNKSVAGIPKTDNTKYYGSKEKESSEEDSEEKKVDFFSSHRPVHRGGAFFYVCFAVLLSGTIQDYFFAVILKYYENRYQSY